MKKFILIAASLCLAAPALAAINCATLPTCASIGYSDASTSCSKYLPCPFDSTKVKCLPEIAKAGDILYSDGTTSYSKIASKTPVGIVVDPGRRYAITLDTVNKAFGNNTKPTYMNLMPSGNLYDTIDANTNGYANTYALRTTEYPAANYCYNYSKSGFSSRRWWLPSPREVTRMTMYFNAIKNGLSRAGGSAFALENGSYYLWTSSIGESASLGCFASPSSPWVRCDIWSQTKLLPVRCFVQY